MKVTTKAIQGCLIGTAVGDALGLPLEGLSRQRHASRFARLQRPNLLFGRGMISDDTEHACITAQALITSCGNSDLFTKNLARQLRIWLLCLPAGTGLATLKACIRLLAGVSPERSGVFSAGNGPAMRSPILGVCYGHDLAKLRDLVHASSRITHTDPKAELGACAVALAAHYAAQDNAIAARDFIWSLQAWLGEEANELIDLVSQAAASAAAGQTSAEFANSLGLAHGFSGYMYHTVPAVLQAWFKYPTDYQSAVLEIVKAGGDTDSTAAILGGIIGARTGIAGIPGEWRQAIFEWPRNLKWMEHLAERLAGVLQTQVAARPAPLLLPGVLLRNIFFLFVVLIHGFRRMMP